MRLLNTRELNENKMENCFFPLDQSISFHGLPNGTQHEKSYMFLIEINTGKKVSKKKRVSRVHIVFSGLSIHNVISIFIFTFFSE